MAAPQTPPRSEAGDIFDPLRTPREEDESVEQDQDTRPERQTISFKRRTASNYRSGPFASLLHPRLSSPSRKMERPPSSLRRSSALFGGVGDDSAIIDDDDDDPHATPTSRRFFSRRHFSSLARRSIDAFSAVSGRSNGGARPPPIPSALPQISVPQDSTPLPLIPIIVLCICMLSEFLSASVTSPFIFFMIEVSFFSIYRDVVYCLTYDISVGFWCR
jgi:hypothetical protein